MKRLPLLQIHKGNYKKVIKYLKNTKINKNYKYEFIGIIKNNDLFYLYLKCFIPGFSNLIYNFGEKSFITSMSDIEHGIMTSVNFYFRFLSLKNFSKDGFPKVDELKNIEDLEMLKENEEFMNQRILSSNKDYCYLSNEKIICINNPFGETRIKVNPDIHINVK